MRRIIHPPLPCSLAGIYRQPLVSRRQLPLLFPNLPAPSPARWSRSRKDFIPYPQPSILPGAEAGSSNPAPALFPPGGCSACSGSRSAARPALGTSALPITNCKLIRSSLRGAEAARESCPRLPQRRLLGAATAWKLRGERGEKKSLWPHQRLTEKQPDYWEGYRKRVWAEPDARVSTRGWDSHCGLFWGKEFGKLREDLCRAGPHQNPDSSLKSGAT